MAQGKQTARQKMINLMYLVFIAMLAMQIDQEIIRSYKDTTQSLEHTRILTENNNNIFKMTLAAKAENSPETFGQAKTDYDGLMVKANTLVSMIEGIKGELSKNAEYDKNQPDISESFAALNNTEPATNAFFADGDENKPSKTAIDLKAKIEDFKSYINQTFGSNPDMKSVVDRTNQQMVTEFSAKDKKMSNNKNWLQYKFYNQPLMAALSNLEVIQSSARGIQGDALSLMLQEKVDANIKFNAYDAVVAAPDVILQGEKAEAKVYIGTYAKDFPITITGVDRTADGQGFKSLNTGSVGQQTFSGKISFTDTKGKLVELPFTHTYNVIAGAHEVKLQSGALVTADKMKVLYRGIQNPVSGSILGADNSQVTLSASGGSVTGGRGQWMVTPGSGNMVKLTISGRDPKGKGISESFDFKIKDLPTPIVNFNAYKGESVVSMSSDDISRQFISANMPPDFDWTPPPVTYTVNSFMFKVPGKAGRSVSGNSLSSITDLTKNLRSGDMALIYEVKVTATGSSGNQVAKKLPNLVINVR